MFYDADGVKHEIKMEDIEELKTEIQGLLTKSQNASYEKKVEKDEFEEYLMNEENVFAEQLTQPKLP